LHSPGFNIHNS